MLSIQRCREILGADAPDSNEGIEALRDELYVVARVWLEAGSPRAALSALAQTTADPEALEERAAIMEFDGGLSRAEAERRVLAAFAASSKVH